MQRLGVKNEAFSSVVPLPFHSNRLAACCRVFEVHLLTAVHLISVSPRVTTLARADLRSDSLEPDGGIRPGLTVVLRCPVVLLLQHRHRLSAAAGIYA